MTNPTEEVATIEIYKEGNRHYLNFISYDEISELLNSRSGCWKEKRIAYKDIVALCNAITGRRNSK